VDEARLERANALSVAGRTEEALEEYRGLLESCSDASERVVVILNEVDCLIELDRFEEAHQRLKVAYASVSPADEMLMHVEFAEGSVWMGEGKNKEALERLNRLLRDHPKLLKTPNHHFLCEEIQQRRGFLLANLRRCAEAKPILEECADYESNKGMVAFYLGYCYCALDDFVLAKQKLLEALAMGLPSHLEFRAHHALGIAYHELEAYARAKKELELCLCSADESYRQGTFKWLASACAELGLNEEAERYKKLAKNPGGRE
jgi:tetratricopeptide (TPR) repeat protein